MLSDCGALRWALLGWMRERGQREREREGEGDSVSTGDMKVRDTVESEIKSRSYWLEK